jgi:hypothetical protein
LSQMDQPPSQGPDTGGQLPAGAQYEPPQVEQLLSRAVTLVEAARPMPLSASSMINKEEVLGPLHEAIQRLPDELRAARWLLKEREEFLSKVRREGDEILEQARARAERMVQRTEVVKAADQRGRQVVEAAESEARRMRHEVEDFCDQKLGSFEIVLEKTLQIVSTGRGRLQANPLDGLDQAASVQGNPPGLDELDDGGFFDQDIE